MIIQLTMAKVTTDQLNDRCLAIIKKFTKKLRKHNGTILNIEDECVIRHMMLHTKISQCPALQRLFDEFKIELMGYIESPEFDLAHALNAELLQAVQHPVLDIRTTKRP